MMWVLVLMFVGAFDFNKAFHTTITTDYAIKGGTKMREIRIYMEPSLPNTEGWYASHLLILSKPRVLCLHE